VCDDSPPTSSVVLRSETISLETELGRAFVSDCAKFTEGLLAAADIKSKWGLSDETWSGLEQNAAVLDAVQRERERRVMNGVAAIEAARREFVKAPSILGTILSTDEVSPRHRIEAARELRAIVSTDDVANGGSGERFTVVINLGGDDRRTYDLRRPTLDLRKSDK